MWIILSLLSALALSVRDISIKKASSKGSPLFSSVAMLALLLPLVVGIIIWERNFDLTLDLSIKLASASLIDSFAIFLYSKSLQSTGKISTSAPILALIPVFQVIFSYLFMDQITSTLGLLGIMLSIIFLSYSSAFSITKILNEKSSIYMLGVALCWGSSSLIHKQGAANLSSLLWTSYVCLISFIILFSCARLSGRCILRISEIPRFWLPALAHFLTLFSFYGASALGNVAYISSIRRLSIVFSVAGGIFIFKEKLTKRVVITMCGLILSSMIITIFG